jgi:hypothetical protein
MASKANQQQAPARSRTIIKPTTVTKTSSNNQQQALGSPTSSKKGRKNKEGGCGEKVDRRWTESGSF